MTLDLSKQLSFAHAASLVYGLHSRLELVSVSKTFHCEFEHFETASDMSARWELTFVAAALVCYAAPLLALNNGLSLKPHMGYNTWNCFYGSSE